MGLTTPNFPAIEPGKTVMDIPYRERIKRFARHWVDYGFGGPKLFPILYIGKLLTFCVTGWAVAALTTGLNPLTGKPRLTRFRVGDSVVTDM